MSDLCPLCHRPAISDAAYWHRSEPIPPGACPRQGSPDCDEAREERIRRMERVVARARDVAHLTKNYSGAMPAVVALVHMRDALRALDGDAP